MKKIVLSAFVLGVTFSGFSQTAPTDSLFIVTYTTGPAWDVSKSPGEQLGFKEHSTNLGTWRKEGVIKFGARYGDKGIIFISAASTEAAGILILGDQAVVNKIFLADIKKLNPFYFGCIEKPK